MRYSRRAEANKAPLITLAVVIVLIGGFWAYRGLTREKVSGSADPTAGPRTYRIVCDKCRQVSELTFAELKKLPESEEGTFPCPECNELGAYAERARGGTAITVPGGG